MNIIADTHTHTIRSGDAFSTLSENIQAAKRRGIKYLCLTEHVFSVFPDAPQPCYFRSMHALPREVDGVKLIRGAEANIISYDGEVDLPDDILDWLDWTIASMHTTALKPATVKEHTDAWIAVAENPLIDVIGHCDDIRFSFDIETTVAAFAKYGKIVEVNNQSEIVRKGSRDFALAVFSECKKKDVPVVVSSDGHFMDYIGRFERSLALLEQIHYPKELILNADESTFSSLLEKKIKNY